MVTERRRRDENPLSGRLAYVAGPPVEHQRHGRLRYARGRSNISGARSCATHALHRGNALNVMRITTWLPADVKELVGHNLRGQGVLHDQCHEAVLAPVVVISDYRVGLGRHETAFS